MIGSGNEGQCRVWEGRNREGSEGSTVMLVTEKAAEEELGRIKRSQKCIPICKNQ